jgi:hypothetical protein
MHRQKFCDGSAHESSQNQFASSALEKQQSAIQTLQILFERFLLSTLCQEEETQTEYNAINTVPPLKFSLFQQAWRYFQRYCETADYLNRRNPFHHKRLLDERGSRKHTVKRLPPMKTQL